MTDPEDRDNQTEDPTGAPMDSEEGGDELRLQPDPAPPPTPSPDTAPQPQADPKPDPYTARQTTEPAEESEEEPPELSKDACNWGMLCHLASLAIFVIPPFGGVIGPLVLWQLKKKEFPFADEQGKEALNFQITVLLALIVCFVVVIPLAWLVFNWVLFVLVMMGITIYNLTMTIIAMLKVSHGEHFRYPISLRLVN